MKKTIYMAITIFSLLVIPPKEKDLFKSYKSRFIQIEKVVVYCNNAQFIFCEIKNFLHLEKI